MAEEANAPQFSIERIYAKDISFEMPNAPQIFLEEKKPEMAFNLTMETAKIEGKEDFHELTMKINATLKADDTTFYIVELSQAGIFGCKNFAEDQLERVLHTFCASILYPYAREAIASLVNRGGFPPINIAPLNFDALYDEQKKRQQEAANKG